MRVAIGLTMAIVGMGGALYAGLPSSLIQMEFYIVGFTMFLGGCAALSSVLVMNSENARKDRSISFVQSVCFFGFVGLMLEGLVILLGAGDPKGFFHLIEGLVGAGVSGALAVAFYVQPRRAREPQPTPVMTIDVTPQPRGLRCVDRRRG